MGSLGNFSFRGRSLVCDTFVETGTYHGDTLVAAAKAGFRRCVSVEVCPANFQRALDRFRILGLSNVALYVGSSPDVLSRVLDPERETLFWLDAHYQGGPRSEMDPDIGECPVLQELAVIAVQPWKIKPVILIDDAVCFVGWDEKRLAAFDRSAWPTSQEIADALPDWEIVEADNILYCIPKERL